MTLGALGLATTAVAWGGRSVTPKSRATVTCATTVTATSFPPRVGDHLRLVLHSVAVLTGSTIQVSRDPKRTYWRFTTKFVVWLKDGGAPAELSVPKRWRARVAMDWADSGNTSSILFTGCPPVTGGMRGWTGGFNLSVPVACVPLDVRVDGRSTRLTFAVGRRC